MTARNGDMHKNDCQVSISKHISALRPLAEYHIIFPDVHASDIADTQLSKGMKTHCVFNYLQSFNINSNPTIDVMHDINEGMNEDSIRRYFLEYFI